MFGFVRHILGRGGRSKETQESEYRGLLERYGTAAVGDPEILLHKRWKGPATVKHRAGDIRVFLIGDRDFLAPKYADEFTRSFDVLFFDAGAHKIACRELRRDPPAFTEKRRKFQGDLIERFVAGQRQRPFDLVFSYLRYDHIDPETFNRMRTETGVPIVNLSLDDKHAFLPKNERPTPNGLLPIIGSIDVNLTNSRDCVRWYLAEGAAARYFPQGVDTALFVNRSLAREIAVSFVGANYGRRKSLIDAIRAQGIPVACFGTGWDRADLTNDEVINVYNRSVINLGVGWTGMSDTITCLKGRDFEVPATGNCYVTTFDRELADHFDIGREIACYAGVDECVEVIGHLLAHREEAEAMGARARERCIREHTWTRRLEDLLHWMGILSDEK